MEGEVALGVDNRYLGGREALLRDVVQGRKARAFGPTA